MKAVFVFALLIAAVAARPGTGDAQIIEYNNEENGDKGYKFSVKQTDTIERQETADFTDLGEGTGDLVVRGSYSYVGDDGQTYVVNYKAGAGIGYVAEGAHIPQ